MTEIPAHIIDQLLYLSEVHESGVGTYRVRRADAVCSAADTVLLPPRYGVVFTPEQAGEEVVFTPEQCAFLPANFGWRSVMLPPRREPIVPAKSEEAPVVISVRRSVLRYAAASVIGLMLLAVSPKTSDVSHQSYASLAPINYAAIVAERNARAEEARLAELAAMQAVERGHYHVIVASVDKANAERYAAELISRGYDAITIERNPNAYRVAIASYATQREALQAMEQLRENSEFARAWVSKK